MKKERDYHLQNPTWCPGCGLYGIFSALKQTFVSRDIDPEQSVIVTGIGCHGRLNNYFRSYGFHTLHGRALPVASGVKLSNPKLSVIAVSGDGDAYSIGMSHFIHSVRRNIGVIYIVADNSVYALTQGQTSPTSPRGYVSVSTPYGAHEGPLNGAQLALAAGGTLIAKGFSGRPGHLASLIDRGLSHRGFALIEVLSPCVTHNKMYTYAWFKERILELGKDISYDPRNKTMAWDALNSREQIPLGVIYEEERPSFEELMLAGMRPLVSGDLPMDQVEFEKILEKFK
jgi:2-oxoglutarate ferredoxin oxidoreductase subunit beta